MEDLKASISQYNAQLSMVNEALSSVQDESERESLLALQSELKELIQLTQESLDALVEKETDSASTEPSKAPESEEKSELDDEYALFMQEMANTGAYDGSSQDQPEHSKNDDKATGSKDDDSDIEDELATLSGMKCAVYHTHKWGGQPTLHNAMVSEVVPPQDQDQFKDLQVRVLFTHPTHAEMLPCPFYLDGECRFDDDKCRYSHGAVVPLSALKDALEPNFSSIKIGSRILIKLKPPDGEDTSLTKKSSEKYHLWHRAIVTSIDVQNQVCVVKLEHGVKTGEKRKLGNEEVHVKFEEIFPLNAENDESSDSDDSLSDTEYPDSKTVRSEDVVPVDRALLIEKSLQNNGPAMGEWERHTRGIGSKLMLAMGYVPGTGLGLAGAGRVAPVQARALPAGRSLDHCLAISEAHAAQDPLKVEQRLKRMQKKEEERNKRAYDREKEREGRNVFNFLNRTIGDSTEDQDASASAAPIDIKHSTSKDLNIEQFKLTEDSKRIEKELIKLNGSLSRYPAGSNGYNSIKTQIMDKNKELSIVRNREQQITKEQRHRKDKQKMTVF